MRPYLCILAAAGLASGAFAEPYSGRTVGAPPGKDDPEKVICKRMPIPGRLDYSRTCKTRREWRAEAESATENGERMMEKGLIKSCATCM